MPHRATTRVQFAGDATDFKLHKKKKTARLHNGYLTFMEPGLSSPCQQNHTTVRLNESF